MPQKPNILLIMSEQTRGDAIGAAPNPYIQTPAIDSLADEGTLFTSTYCTAPVCVASRCSLVLGQYAHQTGCTANSPMPQERTSLMERLQAGGYQTHGAGKMHFTPDSHKLWGYESRDYSEEGGMNEEDDFCNFLRDNGYGHVAAAHGVRSEYYYLPQPSQFPERLHHSHWVVDRSLDFLQQRDPDRPFFLWTSFIKPHPPFANPVPWNRLYKPTEMPMPYMPPDYEDLWTYWNRYQNRYKWRDQGFDFNLLRTMKAAYYAALSFVDYNIGRMLQYLR
ncbi:MAG: sulfatase-like hydrolase/transferase, partial [Armatimonadota bacterium]